MLSIGEIRELLSLHGELRPQARDRWAGEVPLPQPLVEFYEEIGPWGPGPDGIEIPTGGNPTCLPPLHELWGRQAGYRWHGATGERLTEWLDDWLVVAYESPHPFILQVSTGTIMFALAGAGEWRPTQVFPDILTMAAGLGTIGKLYIEAGEWDAEIDEKPEFRALKVERLAEVLGDAAAARHFFEVLYAPF